MFHITRKSLLYGLTALVVLTCLSFSLVVSSPKASAQANASVTKTLTGTITAWTDNALLAGPASQTVTATFTYDDTTGTVTSYTFTPFQLTDPTSGTTVTVSQPSGATTSGTYDAATGALSLTTPLQLSGVPILGTITTDPITLSTSGSITPPDGNTYTGSPVDSAGNVTGVGQTTYTGLITINMWIRFVGVLS